MRAPVRCAPILAALLASATSIASAQEFTDAAPIEPDAGVPSDAAILEPAAPETPEETLPAGVGPIEWAESTGGRNCHRSHGRRVCEGPRRVPRASPEALARQQALGLDQPRVAHHAVAGAPLPEWIAAVPSGEAHDDLLWPVQGGRLWRGFGIHQRLRRGRDGRMRRARGRRRHEGVDIGADPGTPIVAVNDALVVYSDNRMSGYGNVVVLVHRDGSVSLYAHCSATYVAAGELVRRGQIIAAVGATGLAHGSHLHFEWHVEGRPRDPLRRFVGRPARPESDADEPAEDAPEPPDEEPG
ncbi:M23 family metallopeptidase [Sandaracinus amylolyticus]|uniref:M23 family metallopeptidase n=1 Tax=Sandaracinus amylolyticus TaxID=927083 RepID=UPI001F1FC755|nr:M23 family metallopeptidase [Sandaracinus amylolyticus]UJR78845.1 Hypothetical protein I5071_8780 [Sandaracinus amylolyticus]